jgi:energy-converting hydrogenase Eha subunit F
MSPHILLCCCLVCCTPPGVLHNMCTRLAFFLSSLILLCCCLVCCTPPGVLHNMCTKPGHFYVVSHPSMMLSGVLHTTRGVAQYLHKAFIFLCRLSSFYDAVWCVAHHKGCCSISAQSLAIFMSSLILLCCCLVCCTLQGVLRNMETKPGNFNVISHPSMLLSGLLHTTRGVAQYVHKA